MSVKIIIIKDICKSAILILLILFLSACNKGVSITWGWKKEVSSSSFFGISSLDTNNVWAVGECGTIFQYDGSTWNEHSCGTIMNLKAVSALDENHIWAVGTEGTILFYNGSNWEQQPSNVSVELTGVTAVDPNSV